MLLRYLRLSLFMFVTTSLLLFWICDFNLYIYSGDDRELKAVASVPERLFASMLIGAGLTVLCMAVVALFLDRDRT